MDVDKVRVLVYILESISKVAPQHSAIVGWAQRELKAINDEVAEKAREEAEAKAKADEEAAGHARAVAAAEAQNQDQTEHEVEQPEVDESAPRRI